MSVREVARWWNHHNIALRRQMLGIDTASSLTFDTLTQRTMRDVLLIYAEMQRPRSAR